MRSLRARALLVGAVGVLVCAGAATTASGANVATRRAGVEHLPAGFTDTLVATMDRPIALASIGGGRILVADQSGLLRIIDNGSLVPTPALDISAKVCATNSERGLLGLAVDPDFATNGHVYVY